MHHRGSMTKKEIQTIINQGWGERREKNKTEAKKNSARTKTWNDREASLREVQNMQQANIRRLRHYLAEHLDTETVKNALENSKKQK